MPICCVHKSDLNLVLCSPRTRQQSLSRHRQETEKPSRPVPRHRRVGPARPCAFVAREAAWPEAVAATRLLAVTGGTMALKDITKPAVLKAIQECKRLGRKSFLDQYGFGPAKLYRLVYDGRFYDSKAIVGVAHRYVRAGLGPLASFSGGAKTVQPVLEGLGFTVRVGRTELGDIVLPGEVDDDGFDPSNIEDARKRISRMIAQRRGQSAFRNNLFDVYGGRCAITGCEVPDVLEAAHIFPYRGEDTNKVVNGLLLRADVHTLFDCGLGEVLDLLGIW